MSSSNAEGRTKSWDLGIGYDGALDLAHGKPLWKAGRKAIETNAREQAGRWIVKRKSLDYVFANEGEMFDVPSVIQGLPEPWLLSTLGQTGQPHAMKIVIATGASSGVAAEQLADRMTNISAAILVLQALGAPVEVVGTVLHGIGTAEQNFLYTVQACEAGDYIDTSRLVAMAHPAFMRRLGFRLLEQSAHPKLHYVSGYGSPIAYSEAQVKELWGDNAVYLPPVYAGDMAPTVEALLRIVCAKAGIVGIDDADDMA